MLDGRLFLQVEDVNWSLRVRRPAGGSCSCRRRWCGTRVAVSSGGERAPCAYYETRNTLFVSVATRRYAG